MESKLVLSCSMMYIKLIKIHHAVKSNGQFHRLTGEQMNGRTHTALCAHLRFVRYCLNYKHMLYMHR